jgi:hypothetical protein
LTNSAKKVYKIQKILLHGITDNEITFKQLNCFGLISKDGFTCGYGGAHTKLRCKRTWVRSYTQTQDGISLLSDNRLKNDVIL